MYEQLCVVKEKTHGKNERLKALQMQKTVQVSPATLRSAEEGITMTNRAEAIPFLNKPQPSTREDSPFITSKTHKMFPLNPSSVTFEKQTTGKSQPDTEASRAPVESSSNMNQRIL